MQKELQDAVKADIGRDNFVTWFMESGLLEKEIDHAISNLHKWLQPVPVDTPVFMGPAKSSIFYEPLGVVCIMGSWNFPLYTVLAPLIDVISAGNCAVLKPSEIAPNTLRKVKTLLARNLDSSTYVCLEGQVEVAKALSSSQFDCICFTGSSEKGKLVAAAAGKNLVPCILELGGKSPAIVDQGANLELAARKIVMGKFLNAGQICVSPDYILLQHSVTERFVQQLIQAIKDLSQSGANVNDLGRIVNDFHLDRVCDLMKDHQGIVIHGNQAAYEDRNLTPTVILNPSWESPLMQGEIFGPILPIINYQNIEDAIALIKKNEKPLAIYYFGSMTGSNLRKVERGTSSGSLVVNDTLFQLVNTDLPFGGVGNSGMGRYHGYEGFKAFSNAKSLLTKPALNFYPYNRMSLPFTEDKQSLIRTVMKYLSLTQQ